MINVSYSVAGGRAIIRRLLQSATEGWVAAGTTIPNYFTALTSLRLLHSSWKLVRKVGLSSGIVRIILTVLL